MNDFITETTHITEIPYFFLLYLISDLNATGDTGLNFGDGFGPFGDSLISSVTKIIFR